MEWLVDSEPPAFMAEIDEILILPFTDPRNNSSVFDHINTSKLAITIITCVQFKSKY